jgi:hypothetical protein
MEHDKRFEQSGLEESAGVSGFMGQSQHSRYGVCSVLANSTQCLTSGLILIYQQVIGFLIGLVNTGLICRLHKINP